MNVAPQITQTKSGFLLPVRRSSKMQASANGREAMGIRCFFFAATVALLSGDSIGSIASCLSAEAGPGRVAVTPPEQAEVLDRENDVAAVESLLSEFRAARSVEETQYLRESTEGAESGARSRVEIGRDLMKLGRSAVPLLITTLDDPDPEVSAVAALALGQIGDRRAVTPLMGVLQSFGTPAVSDSRTRVPGHVRAQASVWALSRLGDPRAVRAIIALTGMPDRRNEMIEKLAFQADCWHYMCGIMLIVCGDAIDRIGLAAAPELVRLLSDADSRIREYAAHYLARFGDPWPWHRRIESEDALRRRESLQPAIAKRVADLAGPKLIELLQDENADVRRTAAAALGSLHVASAAGPLIRSLKDEDPWVRVAAIHALGRIGDPVALGPLARLMRTPGPEQMDCAERAIAAIGGPRAFTLLSAALNDGRVERRVAAIRALGVVGTPEAADLLIAALDDSYSSARNEAIEVLGRFKGPAAARAVAPLIAILHDEEVEREEEPLGARIRIPRDLRSRKTERILAIRSLGELADSRATEVLLDALKDPDWQTRGEALQALGRIKDAKSVQGVTAILKDPDGYPRLCAVHTLILLNPPDLADRLRSLQEDEDESVREAVAPIVQGDAKPGPEE